MRSTLRIVFALALLLMMPANAQAEEVDYVASLASGFESLLGNSSQEDTTPESDFIEDYEPELLEVQTREVEEYDDTPLGNIQSWFANFKVPVEPRNGITYYVTLDRYIMVIFGGFSPGWGFAGYFEIVLGLVFAWWGVRKSWSIIYNAWRKGKVNA